MRSLFAFCVSNGWLGKSPMDTLKKPVVHRGKPTDYFPREEFSKIVDATYVYEYGGGNDCRFRKDRLRALVLLMHACNARHATDALGAEDASGAPSDACTEER
jgi:hypothetical protein